MCQGQVRLCGTLLCLWEGTGNLRQVARRDVGKELGTLVRGDGMSQSFYIGGTGAT